MTRRGSSATRMALVRARLELPTVRRAVGHTDGHHSSILTGHGIDFDDQVDYRPGDDVSSIDWKSSARAGHPIIRRFERESDVFTQLVLDTGRDMLAAAPSRERKSDIALWASDVLAYLGSHRGDRLGLVWGDAGANHALPARHGRDHVEFLLASAERAYENASAPSDVAGLLARALTVTRQRSLIILVTDEAWPKDSDMIRRVRSRHELFAVRIGDMPMTEGGVDQMVDIGTGEIVPAYVRGDRVLARHVQRQREGAAETARRLLQDCGVHHATISSSDEVVPLLVDVLRRRRG